jgi:predicted nucleic acid-binding protein
VTRLCLDTSAYGRFQRGDVRAAELIDEAEWVGMPAITLGELWSGFRLGARRERSEVVLREFLANPVVEEDQVGWGAPATHHCRRRTTSE